MCRGWILLYKCVKVIVQMFNDMLDWLYQCDLYFYQISSASNCTDYQSRRLNIKYREKSKEAGVHVETVKLLISSWSMVMAMTLHFYLWFTVYIIEFIQYSKNLVYLDHKLCQCALELPSTLSLSSLTSIF